MSNDELSLGICGTAFRHNDYDKLSLELYNEMYRVADKLIEYINSKDKCPLTTLISGGSAGADSIAVRLYLNNRIPNLKLYLPCDYENGEFIDNYSDLGIIADTINFYHTQFEKETKQNSLKEIQLAIDKGADITIIHGFKNRNTNISMAHYLLAMTFGEGAKVKKGGTEDTVRKYLNRIKENGISPKIFHYNIEEGKMYPTAKL